MADGRQRRRQRDMTRSECVNYRAASLQRLSVPAAVATGQGWRARDTVEAWLDKLMQR
jgi:hypothetical protein